MKKIIVIAFVLSLVAAPVFAYTDSVVVDSATICVLSKNVTLDGASSTQQFAASAAHLNGSSVFGTTSQSTSIYKTAFDGSDYKTPTASDTSAFSGWTTM